MSKRVYDYRGPSAIARNGYEHKKLTNTHFNKKDI